jgi:hypothetical protein
MWGVCLWKGKLKCKNEDFKYHQEMLYGKETYIYMHNRTSTLFILPNSANTILIWFRLHVCRLHDLAYGFRLHDLFDVHSRKTQFNDQCNKRWSVTKRGSKANTAPLRQYFATPTVGEDARVLTMMSVWLQGNNPRKRSSRRKLAMAIQLKFISRFLLVCWADARAFVRAAFMVCLDRSA